MVTNIIFTTTQEMYRNGDGPEASPTNGGILGLLITKIRRSLADAFLQAF